MAKDLQYTLSLKDLFSKQMRGAVDSTKQMDAKVSSLSSSFGKLGGVISGAFAIGQVVNFGKAVFASLDNYQQFKQGEFIPNLSILDYIFFNKKRVGVANDF